MSPEIPSWAQAAIDAATAEYKDAIGELVATVESLLACTDTNGYMNHEQIKTVRLARYLITRFKKPSY